MRPGNGGAAAAAASVAADPEAVLRAAYTRWGGLVWRLGRRMLPSDADADDLTVATFVAAWRERDTFDPEDGGPGPWLLGLARRELADRLRSAHQGGRARATGPVVVPATGYDRDADRVLDRLVVADELARLREEQRLVLRLALCDDAGPNQIAEQTDLSVGTVRSHLRQGLERLRDSWQEVDRVAHRP